METPKRPFGFIQYKGTDICMDLNCECGELSHIDGDFVYAIQCPYCDKKYDLNCFIKLEEFTGEHHEAKYAGK